MAQVVATLLLLVVQGRSRRLGRSNRINMATMFAGDFACPARITSPDDTAAAKNVAHGIFSRDNVVSDEALV